MDSDQGFEIVTENKFLKIDVDVNKVDIEKLFDEVKRTWKRPELIISIHGGAKKMVAFDADEKLDFKTSLLKVIKHSNTWIITAGKKIGVTELVGDAANDYKLLHGVRQFKLLGFATKNKVEWKDLDSNHDGCMMTEKKAGEDGHSVGSNFRTQFEGLLAKKNIPIVMILLEGGESSVETAAKSIEKDIPLIVFKGSKRAADLIAHFVQSGENITIEKCTEYIDTITDFEEFEKSLQNMIKKKKLINIIDVKDINNELDRMITKTAFSKSNNDKEILDLQMSYNRHDIAREDISKFLALEENLQKEMFKEAWKHNLFHFINLYTLYGIEIDKMLPSDELNSNLSAETLIGDKGIKNEMLTICNLKPDKSVIEKFNALSHGIYNKHENSTEVNRSYEAIKDSNNDGKKEYHRERFILCLILQRFEMARLVWKYNPNDDMLGLALLGCVICKSMSRKSGKQGENEIKAMFLVEKQFYLDLAVGLLTKAQEVDKNKAQKLTILEVEESDVKTPMEIASKNGLMEFLNHSVCQSRISYIWYGQISSYTSIWRLCLSLVFFPLILRLITFTDKKKTDDNWKMDDGTTEVIDSKYLHCCKKFKYFFSAPIVRFMMNCVSYITFLTLLTYVCLVDLDKIETIRSTHRIPEYLVYIYVLALVIEEIRQVCSSSDGNWNVRIIDWWSSAWNKFDAFILVIFLIAIVLRFIPSVTVDFVYARTLFCFSLTLFYIRFLQFYMPLQMLGPKVIMITKMMRDIGFFIAIYVIVLLAYGTYAQGLLYPNSNLTWPTVKSIYYLPYWQTYGELSLEYVQGESKEGPRSAEQNSTVVVAFALFMLCSNVLLLNLLIAMFGNTYTKIESVSKQIWGFYRYHLVKEYYERPILPPPFNLFEIIWKLIRVSPCCNRSTESSENKFFMSKEKSEDLRKFLKVCTQTYLRKNPLITDEKDFVVNSKEESSVAVTSL